MNDDLLEPGPVAAIDEHGTRVQGMFGRIAHGYDRANRWMSLGIDTRWRAEAVARMMPVDVGPRPRVLDLCAGTLDGSVAIHEAYPRAHIVAGDFSREMLEHGLTKLNERAAANIEARTMDAHALPLTDRSLDAIFCAFGIRNVSDLPRATAEQARCLRPGGVLTVLEFFRPTALVPRVLHTVYSRTVLPLIGWAATGDLDAYTYLPRSIGRFLSAEEYGELLRKHGFGDVEIRPLTFGMAWVIRAVRRAGGPR